jgi:predicted transcriptional regulator of viral defense system
LIKNEFNVENFKTHYEKVFPEKVLIQDLKKLESNNLISERQRKKLYKDAKSVQLKWNMQAEYKLLSYAFGVKSIFDIFSAIQTKYYLSHHSALYFHGMTDQRPQTYYLSKEIKGREPIHSEQRVQAKILQIFSKTPRVTSNYFEYNKIKVNLLEKQDLNRIGVIQKILKQNETHELKMYLTSVERTFIDIVISPHYSGGLKTVILAYLNSKINLDKLYEIYKVYSPYYPYWQSIGLLLEKTHGMGVSKKWQSKFSNPKEEFYLDRGFRDTWSFDEKWKVYYPEGIFQNCTF